MVQSPVLVGRDSFLTLVERRLTDAAAGEGGLLFVAGEAGIGKTRLLSALAQRASANGFAAVRAAAFPGDVQSLASACCATALSRRVLPMPASPATNSSPPSPAAASASLRSTRVRKESRPTRTGDWITP